MLRHLQRILFVLFAMQAWTRTRGQAQPSFPKISDIVDEFYQTEVQISDQNQDASALANEYYDQTELRGRVDVLVYGSKLSIFYYNLTGDVLEVNSTSCVVSADGTSEYQYYEMFFGWLNKDPLIIGPSALLWYAQILKPDYVDQVPVRGIMCDHWQLVISGINEKLTYDYYFAVKGWTTPYQIKNKRVPIRVAISGESSRDSNKKTDILPVNQIVDFSYFRPTIEDGKLHPDIGLGCYGKSLYSIMPKIPQEFKFSSEVYDLYRASELAEIDAIFRRVWFSNYTQLGRIDVYEKDSMKSNLVDFSNGVIYSIKNRETCTISPLRNSYFILDEDLMGRVKTPEEILGLSGDFYFMGFSSVRGINCRTFESAQRDIYHTDGYYYYLLVTTVFFTEPYTEVVVQGEEVINVPVMIQVTGYDEPNHVSMKVQHNIFGFDNVVGPTLYDYFPIQDCFPLAKQRSYFVLASSVETEIAAILEANNVLFTEQVKSEIIKLTRVSPIRIPFMKADYLEIGVYVTGLMLERPSALSQFWRQYYGPTKAQSVVKVDDITDKEACAYACVGEVTFVCKGFHFCGSVCYLNQKSITEEMIHADEQELGMCELYLRAEMNSTNNDLQLEVVLDILSKSTLKASVPLEKETIEVTFSEIEIGEGSFQKNINDKSYTVVYYGFELQAEDDTTTTVDKSYITTENDCYRACREDTTIACQSFSYCPDSEYGSCRISSVLMAKGIYNNLDAMENNKLCNVYALPNIEYFTPYPGQVLMFSGRDSYSNLTADECAEKCRKVQTYKCRGFEYCSKKKSCVLHDKHVLDTQPGDVITTSEKCTHYAAKFSADYLDMGYLLIDDFSNERKDITLEECSRACSEDMATCFSFNYCPPSNEYERDSSCALISQRLTGSSKTVEKGKCRLYMKRDTVENYGTKSKDIPTVYTKTTFTGLVIGMLVFGLLVGVGVFVGYSYYRSRKYSDGMSVRFMKQTDS